MNARLFFRFLRNDLRQLKKLWATLRLDRAGLCVAGYPRSCNTFLVHALLQMGLPYETLVHHQHNPWVALWCAWHGLPVLVPVRDPVESVASLMIYKGKDDEDTATEYLARWRYWHWLIRAFHFLQPRIVLLGFCDITRNVNLVARQVGSRFGIALRELDHATAVAQSRAWSTEQFERERRSSREYPHPKPTLEGDKAALRRMVLRSPGYAASAKLYRALAKAAAISPTADLGDPTRG